MTTNELLQKVIDTTTVGAGGGGLLNAEQSNQFIHYIWDATALGADTRTVRMRATEVDLDAVGVGTRLLRAATEATDTGVNAGATFTKITITTKKMRLDWELSTESLEDGIEGASLEDHVARLMATQVGNDLEDLAINGDTTSLDLTLKIFDGWRKRALAGGHVVDAAGAALTGAVFNKALYALPRKYKQRRQQLRFYTGSNLVQDYLYALTQISTSPQDIAAGIIRGNPAGPDGAPGGLTPFAFGVPVKEVPLFVETQTGTYSGASGNHGTVELTFPQNRLWGIKRDITVYREFEPKTDAIEYTLYLRSGVQIENLDAYVIVKNVKVVGE